MDREIQSIRSEVVLNIHWSSNGVCRVTVVLIIPKKNKNKRHALKLKLVQNGWALITELLIPKLSGFHVWV